MVEKTKKYSNIMYRFFSFVICLIKKVDSAAVSLFEQLSSCSKSFVAAGLISGTVLASCAAAVAVYIFINGYSMELNDILNMLIDRSAALPAISLFLCLISELCRVK